MDKKINDFIIFCVEVYKSEKNLEGKQIYEIFSKHGVFRYLEEEYDTLHTKGKEWLIEDIDIYLEN